MRPPESIDLCFYGLKLAAADGQRLAIFQQGHAAADPHDLGDVHNAAPVNKEKVRAVQFRKDLLQAFAHFGEAPGGNNAGVLSLPLDVLDLPQRDLFQAAFGLNCIALARLK